MSAAAIADRLAYLTPAELAKLGVLLRNDRPAWCAFLDRLAHPELPMDAQSIAEVLSGRNGFIDSTQTPQRNDFARCA